MGLSVNILPYTGGIQTFPVTFALGILERQYVTVEVIGEVDGAGDQVQRGFTWNSDSEILITDALPNPCRVRIARSMPRNRLLVDFNADGSITRSALDRSSSYNAMLVHEALDGRLEDGQDLATSLAQAAQLASDAADSALEAAASAAEAGAFLYNTVAELKADASVQVGTTVSTRGYTAAGDGGAMIYEIVGAATGTDDGGSYIDLPLVSLQAKAQLTTSIHAASFGAVHSTGSTDAVAAFNNLFDYIRANVNDNGGDPFVYAPTYHVFGGMYAINSTLSVDARSMRVHCDFIAGTTWTSGATDPVLKLTAGAGYANFDGIVDCNRKASGIWVIAGRVDLGETNVFHMSTTAGSYGVKFGDGSGAGGGGGDSWLRGGHVTQWYPEDAEFDIEASWTSDCVVIDRADTKLLGTTLRWARRLVYLTAAANTFKASACHLINGGASSRVRVNPILLESERIGNIVLTDNYLDNGTIISRAKRFTSANNQSIELNDRSDVDFKFTFYPYSDGEYPEVRINDMHMFNIMDGDLVRFANEPGYSWPMPSSTLEGLINTGKEHIDIGMPRIRARIPRGAAGAGEYTDVLATTRGSNDGARQLFVDRDTPSLAVAPYARSAGEDLALGAPNGSAYVEDVNGVTKLVTTNKFVLFVGASGTAGSSGATGGNRGVFEGTNVWDSDTTTATYTPGTQFNQVAYGTAPFNVGSSPYANTTAMRAMQALREQSGANIYGAVLAKGGHAPEAFITDARLATEGWTRDPGDEDMTAHYANIASAITAMPGDKTVADYLVYYQSNGANQGFDHYHPRAVALLEELEAAGLIDKDHTKIALVAANPDRTAHLDPTVSALSVISARDFANATLVLQNNIPTFDGTHPSGTGTSVLGNRVASALLGPVTNPDQIVLASSDHAADEARGAVRVWNGDNMHVRMTSDEGNIELNLNANTGNARLTRDGTDIARFEATGIEATPIGASTPATGEFTSLVAALLTGGAVQSATTDTTTGKVLLNGAHGLGATTAPGVTNNDCDDVTVTGFYTFDSAVANVPSFTSNGMLWHIARTSTIHAQIAISRSGAGAGRMASRVGDGGTWTAWRELALFDPDSNLSVGTATDWQFPANWKGVRVTDRHAVQATPNASSMVVSSNAAVGPAGWEYTVSAAAGNYNQSGGLHRWNYAPAGTVGDPVTWTEAMRLDTDGRLHIGHDGSVTPGIANAVEGTSLHPGGRAIHSRDSGPTLDLARVGATPDGKIQRFHRSGLEVGSISVKAGAITIDMTAAGVIWTTGAGTPEGFLAAPVGSMYTRTDGGVGTTLYVKETGTGLTGWAAK